ncbi:MAG: hypothetical protein IK117_12100 [Bacteroidales bacterium]|nr:hypothetical protein [Bacteroidales bacterium]
MKRVFIYCILLCACLSCSKKKAEPDVAWDKYYPTKIGSGNVYEFTQIKIDVLAERRDTSVFYVQELFSACISDTNSCKVYAVNSFKSETPYGPWQPYLSSSVQKYPHSIVEVEQNVPYQILKFPAKFDYSWDLNLFNTNDEQLAHYEKIQTTDTILGVPYDSVLVVLQQDFKTLYSWQYGEARYAKNIGMIYRKAIDVESQPNHAQIDLSKPIEERITKGSITQYRLVYRQQ